MSVSNQQLEALKQKILAAFADVPYPKGVITSHECPECFDVRETFAGQDWKTIAPEIIEENFGKISLFSPEAFHFFLPAYLIYSLEHFDEQYDTVCEFTIYAVAPSNKDIQSRCDYEQKRFENFTTEQMNCIYEFLDFAEADENFESFVDEIRKGRQNLKKFIDPNLRK
jgi:hypothetical protein